MGPVLFASPTRRARMLLMRGTSRSATGADATASRNVPSSCGDTVGVGEGEAFGVTVFDMVGDPNVVGRSARKGAGKEVGY
jgi:hypothetical protein